MKTVSDEDFLSCYFETAQINSRFAPKRHQFMERISQWMTMGSELFDLRQNLLVIPSDLVEAAIQSSKNIIESLCSQEYEKFVNSHSSLFPEEYYLMQELKSTGPEAYILDWALTKENEKYSLMLIELNQGIQENLSLVYWPRAFLNTIGIDLGGKYKPCCNDVDQFIAAMKVASRSRTVIWLSYLGHECQLFHQVFKNPLVNPWELEINDNKLFAHNQMIEKVLSLYYYPCCLKSIHKKSLECIQGSILDKMAFEDLKKTKVDWWPSFHGFYKYSKFSLPYLWKKYPDLVPESYFIDDFKKDLNGFIHKPLYLYSAIDFNINPTYEDIEQSPKSSIIQQKVEYYPAVIVPSEEDSKKNEKRKLELRCYAIKNSNGEFQIHCGYGRLMKPFICNAQPDYNNYNFGGEMYMISN